MKTIDQTQNNYFTNNPSNITLEHLNNFKYNFPAHRNGLIQEVYNSQLNSFIEDKKSMNSEYRLKQSLKEFLNEIEKFTFKFGLDYNKLLSDDQLVKILIYILENSEYTYYDLVQ